MKQGYLRTTPSNDPDHVAMWAEKVGARGWLIRESYPAISFTEWKRGEALPELGKEFAGRLFGLKGELRWTREGNNFDLWLLEDVQAAGERTTLFEVTPRFCYGLGYWTGKNGRFWEPSLPGDRVNYPIAGSKDGDRPRFQIFEYCRLSPNDTGWPDDADGIEDLINRPSLAAWRLAGFDAGKDEELPWPTK